MTNGESPTEPANLVYGEVEGSLVFVPRNQAQELAVIWNALGSSSTWGEFRSLVPPKRYEETLGLMVGAVDFDSFFAQESQVKPGRRREEALSAFREIDVGERLPLDDDPFPGYDLPWVADGDYPEWATQEMLKWVPQEIINQPYSKIEDSVEGVSDQAVIQQAKTDEVRLSVAFDDFSRCASCGKLILEKDVRLYFPPGANSSPPYCINCYATLKGK